MIGNVNQMTKSFAEKGNEEDQGRNWLKKNKKKARKNVKKGENKAKMLDADENIKVGGGWHPS